MDTPTLNTRHSNPADEFLLFIRETHGRLRSLERTITESHWSLPILAAVDQEMMVLAADFGRRCFEFAKIGVTLDRADALRVQVEAEQLHAGFYAAQERLTAAAQCTGGR